MRDDLGRTVAEIGARLTPAHLMEQAKRSLQRHDAGHHPRGGAVGDRHRRRRRVPRHATWRSTRGTRCRRIRTRPAPSAPASARLLRWRRRRMRNRRRLIPREWDEPFDRSSRRRRSTPGGGTGRSTRSLPLAAALAAAFADLADPRLQRRHLTSDRYSTTGAPSDRGALNRDSSDLRRVYDVGFFAPIVFDSSCTCCRWSFSVGSVLAANALTSLSPDAVRPPSRTP